MYGAWAAALVPVAFLALSVTWGFWYLVLSASLGFGWFTALLSVAMIGLLFFLNRFVRAETTTGLYVDPAGRDIEPVSLDIPRGAGMTWMMYLSSSRELAGPIRVITGLFLFGPRVCTLIDRLARAAKTLATLDADDLAGPVKTLVRAEGKVAFPAFLEAHPSPPPQALVDRLGLIDGIIFLPTSSPPGLTASNAMKDDFAAWRDRWHARHAGGPRDGEPAADDLGPNRY